MFNLKTMNKLAIFDLDNTLLNGDSDRNWGLFLAEKILSTIAILERVKSSMIITIKVV